MDKHFERAHVGQQLIVAASFEPIIQRSVGPSPKLAFKAALATQPGKTACARSRNDRPRRLDLAILDDFVAWSHKGPVAPAESSAEALHADEAGRFVVP